MKILFTADIHVDPRHLDRACEAALNHAVDALIIGGDLIPHSRPRLAPQALLQDHADYLRTVLIPRLEAFKREAPCTIYLDLGNDDLRGARGVLEACDGHLLHLLHGRKHPLTRRMDIIGYMNVPPTPFVRKDWEKPDTRLIPYEPDNRILTAGYISSGGRIENKRLDLTAPDTIESDLDRLSQTVDRPFVFVSHGPPHDTPLDVLTSGLHVGSRAVRRFIEEWAARGLLPVSLHGHIHESPFRSGSIQARIGSALSLNPGQWSSPPTALRYVVFRLLDLPPTPRVQLLHIPSEPQQDAPSPSRPVST